MLHKNNVKKVFVARNCARTGSLTPGNLASNLAHGEIVIVDQNGQIIDSVADANAATSITIMQGVANEPPYISDVIRKGSIYAVYSSLFAQRQEKKVFVGYNMAAGSINVIASNVYAIEIDSAYKNNPLNPSAFTTRASYESAFSGATQYDIAKGMAQILGPTYSQFTHGIRVNIVSSSAEDAANTLIGCEVIEGETVLAYTSLQAAAPAVGTVLSIPGATGAHRAETKVLYEIVYLDTANNLIELDRPYTNRTQTGIAVEPIADETTGNFGLSFEGVSPTPIKKGEAIILADFTVVLDGFGTTIQTQDTDALALYQGFGRSESVANAHFMHQGGGSERNKYQDREFQNDIQEAIAGNGYSMIKLMYQYASKPNNMEVQTQFKEVDIYLDRNTYALIAATDAATAFGTNIQTGAGLVGDAGTNGSVINVINAIAVNAGLLTATANTTANGGNEMTPGITDIGNAIDV